MSDDAGDTQRSDAEEIAPAPRRRRGWLRLLLYLVIFLSGGIVGTGTTLMIIRKSALFAVHHPGEMPGIIADRMERALDLDDEQKRQILDILHERQEALQDIRRQSQPLVEEQLDLLEEQVAAVLDPEQQENWRSRIEHIRRTWIPVPPPQRRP